MALLQGSQSKMEPIDCVCINILYCTGHEPGTSVGIATDYGLDGPGIESWWGEIFCPTRPALRPTQLPVQWVPSLSQE